jgi:hypothetical protein
MAVGLTYAAIGLFLIIRPENLHNIVDSVQMVRAFGGLLIFYGAFRVYRVYKTPNEKY